MRKRQYFFLSFSDLCMSRNKEKAKHMNEQIWKYIAELPTPGFFITADIAGEDKEFPESLKGFIYDKLALIRQGISARKFTFRAGEWRIYLTFFPTDRVVDEHYALKNKMMKVRSKSTTGGR